MSWENFSKESLSPGIIALGNPGMETVEKIEFAGYLIPNTSRGARAIECFVNLQTGVKCPGRLGMIEVGNSANIAR